MRLLGSILGLNDNTYLSKHGVYPDRIFIVLVLYMENPKKQLSMLRKS